jgi:hypothetical protein
MKVRLTILTLCLLVSASVFGQTHGCPKIWVEGPRYAPEPGEAATFEAKIDAAFEKRVKGYTWQVSSGKIRTGQHKPKLVVISDKSGQNLTVTVGLIGLPARCERYASETAAPFDPPSMMQIDEFAPDSSGTLRNTLSEPMQRDGTDRAFVLVGILARESLASMKRKVNRIIRDLSNTKGFPSQRVHFIIQRPGDRIARVYLVPRGVEPPRYDAGTKCIRIH